VRFRGSVGDTGSYHRFADGKLLWAGAATTRNTNTQALARRLRADIGQIYPLLRQVEIERAASAAVATTVHRMPQVGELLPGVWLGAAFGRRGLATAAMTGLLIARAIVNGDDRWRLFSPFGLVSSGGRTGRALAEAALKARRAAIYLQNFVARYRITPQPALQPVAASSVPEEDRLIALEAERRWLETSTAPSPPEPTPVPPLAPVIPVAAESPAAEAEPKAPAKRKKAATPRKRAPGAVKVPAPADVIAVSRQPARKRAATKATSRRKSASKKTPTTTSDVSPATPEQSN
jgi:hypothetical protein